MLSRTGIFRVIFLEQESLVLLQFQSEPAIDAYVHNIQGDVSGFHGRLIRNLRKRLRYDDNLSPEEWDMYLRGREFEPADELDDDVLLMELKRLIGGAIAIRFDPPACRPGEVWLRRTWLVAAHKRTRHWRGDNAHMSYRTATKKQLLGELGAVYGFDVKSVAESSDERVEVKSVYEGLREVWETSEETHYRPVKTTL